MGQIEINCISNIGKNISILAKATQVSNVAHGPLVIFPLVLLLENLLESVILFYVST
jgi:hypothetical protein